MEMQRATFYLLEKFTGSTLSANRMAVWRLVDPVLLLQCVLCMITEYAKQVFYTFNALSFLVHPTNILELIQGSFDRMAGETEFYF